MKRRCVVALVRRNALKVQIVLVFHGEDFDLFGRVKVLLGDLFRAKCEEEVHLIVLGRPVGLGLSCFYPFSGFIAGFFEQFALCD